MNYDFGILWKERRKEVIALREIIERDEKICIAVSGMMVGYSVLFTVTDKRAILLGGRFLDKVRADFPLESIKNVGYRKGFIMSTLYFSCGDGLETISHISNLDIQNVVVALNKHSSKAQPQRSGISTADEIRKFMSLLNEGIITEQEFQKKKQELLK